MKIILCSYQEQGLHDAWVKYCGDLDFVEIHDGSILDLHVEAIVSPANSFGFMDGGIDWLYTKKFGWKIQERIQKIIKEKHNNELLVGQSLLVKTDLDQIRYVISAPTMRVPTILAKNTINPFLAAKAALICAKDNFISSMAIPGLGTGVGQVSFEKCALQVREAIDEVILNQYIFPISWRDALDRHTYLYTGLRNIDSGQTKTDEQERM